MLLTVASRHGQSIYFLFLSLLGPCIMTCAFAALLWCSNADLLPLTGCLNVRLTVVVLFLFYVTGRLKPKCPMGKNKVV